MSIDEAINILKQYVDYDNPDVPDFYTMEEAIKVIIKALEQEPSYNSIKTELEPCEDAVSRQAAIDAITKTSGIRGDALKALYDLPPVTPQPKMGRWIRVDKDKLGCSECGVIHLIAQYPYGKIGWCPNCGAKMQEVKNES